MKKLALFLILALLLSILPASALAADIDFAAAAEEALKLAEEAFPNALASEDAEELYASAQAYSRRYTAMLPDASDGDMQKAQQLYLKAAELGLAKAQYAAARNYSGALSYPIEPNEEESFHLALQAAEQGYLNAYTVLIGYYRNGTGTEPDEDAAKQWEEKLAADAASLLEEADSTENADAEKLVMAGDICRFGIGTEENIDKALEYYVKAAEAGSAAGARTLGGLYRQSYETEKDLPQSIAWYTKAWEMGDEASGYALVSIYRIGDEGMEPQPDKAAALLQELAAGGDEIAQSDLADMYMSGEGIAWDSEKAFEWYIKAAAQDYAYAECQLAEIFEYGLSGSDYNPLIEPDTDLAKAFYTRAAEQDYPYAREALTNLPG